MAFDRCAPWSSVGQNFRDHLRPVRSAGRPRGRLVLGPVRLLQRLVVGVASRLPVLAVGLHEGIRCGGSFHAVATLSGRRMLLPHEFVHEAP